MNRWRRLIFIVCHPYFCWCYRRVQQRIAARE